MSVAALKGTGYHHRNNGEVEMIEWVEESE